MKKNSSRVRVRDNKEVGILVSRCKNGFKEVIFLSENAINGAAGLFDFEKIFLDEILFLYYNKYKLFFKGYERKKALSCVSESRRLV